MYPNDQLEELLDNQESSPNEDTLRYLQHIENRLYEDITARKRIDSGILFLACQVGSCSLSWLLFELRVTLAIIQVFSACVALIPGLIHIGDGFNFEASSENWRIGFGEKPLIGIAKLLIGGAVSFSGTSRITKEVLLTHDVIAETYKEIRANNGLTWQLPSMNISLLIALIFMAVVIYFKSLGNPNVQDK
jgi:hypothetical protein